MRFVAGAVVVALSAAAPVWAGHQERPDIPDVPFTSFTSTFVEGGNVVTNDVNATIYDTQSSTTFYGYVNKFVSTPAGSEGAWFTTELFEADKVERKLDDQKINQKDFASLVWLTGFTTAGASSSTNPGTPVDGCKTKVKLSDESFGAYNAAKGVSQCNDGVLNSFITQGTIRAVIQELIGVRSDGTGVKAVVNIP
ncbi:MAG: hypothetical protein ACREQJ_12595 [Candidatus Binatia bacterium]